MKGNNFWVVCAMACAMLTACDDGLVPVVGSGGDDGDKLTSRSRYVRIALREGHECVQWMAEQRVAGTRASVCDEPSVPFFVRAGEGDVLRTGEAHDAGFGEAAISDTGLGNAVGTRDANTACCGVARGNTRAENGGFDPATPSSSDIPSSMPQSIGVWAYSAAWGTAPASAVFENQEMFNILGAKYQLVKDNLNINTWDPNNDWPYAPQRAWGAEGMPYKFFAYSPYAQRSLTDGVSVRAGSYEGFGGTAANDFIWRKIPKYSGEDYMIADAIRTYSAKTSQNEQQLMVMRHLMARLRFRFRLGDRFGDRRYIVIKHADVVALQGRTMQLAVSFVAEESIDGEGNRVVSYPATFRWTSDETLDYTEQSLNNEPDEYGNPIESITISAAYNKAADAAGVTRFQALASMYAYPYDPLDNVVLRITYDVYDIEGQLLRENEQSQNTIQLGMHSYNDHGMTEENGTLVRYLEAGYYYNVNITIEPDFMYVLDDNDGDVDGWMEISEE